MIEQRQGDFCAHMVDIFVNNKVTMLCKLVTVLCKLVGLWSE